MSVGVATDERNRIRAGSGAAGHTSADATASLPFRTPAAPGCPHAATVRSRTTADTRGAMAQEERRERKPDRADMFRSAA
jgi:hypothetical protein